MKQKNFLHSGLTRNLYLFQGIALINLFHESRLVYLNPHRPDDEEENEQSLHDKGRAEEKDVLHDFDVFQNPLDNKGAQVSPARIISGTRDRFMRGPFGNLNVHTGGAVLDRRVESSLKYYANETPEEYLPIIEEFKLRNLNRRSWFERNILSDKRLNDRITKEFFLYDIEKGQNYDAFINNIQRDIEGLGLIGGGFEDVNFKPVNLSDPLATNEFEAGVGAPANLANKRIVIRWHEENMITIQRKLEMAGKWNEFTETDKGWEFVKLKLRHSHLKQVIFEEKAKENKITYDKDILKDWLNREWMDRALSQDNKFKNWVANTLTPECARLKINSTEDMQKKAPLLFNELTREQNEAKVRVGKDTLETQLRKILIDGEMDDIKTPERLSLLAYLQSKLSNPNKPDIGNDVRNFLENLAGKDFEGNLNGINENQQAIEQFLPGIKEEIAKINSISTLGAKKTLLQTSITRSESTLGGYDIQIKILNSEIQVGTPTTPVGLTAPRGKPLPKKILDQKTKLLNDTMNKRNLEEKRLEALNVQMEKLDEDIADAPYQAPKSYRKIIEEIITLGKVFNKSKDVESIWGGELISLLSPPEETLLNKILRISNKPPTTEADIERQAKKFIVTLKKGSTSFEKLTAALSSQKSGIEKKKKSFTAKKLDSRTLLNLLVQRDLKEKEVTEQTTLDKKSAFVTNSLIARCVNHNMAQDVNEAIGRHIRASRLRRRWDAIKAWRFFSPTKSGQDIIEHVTDTIPELAMFRNISLFSTRKDLINSMEVNGYASPEQIRKFCGALKECIKGFKKPTEGKEALVSGIHIIDRDVKMVENLVNMLTNLEIEFSTKQYISNLQFDERSATPSGRAQATLELFQEQTEARKNIDSEILQNFSRYDSKFKRLFIKSEIIKNYNEVLAENEGLPSEELQAKLAEAGITRRVQKRGVAPTSLRGKRYLKTLFTSGYSPLAWVPYHIAYRGIVYWGVYRGIGGLLGFGKRKAIEIAKEKGQLIKHEYEEGRKLSKPYTEGAIIKTTANAVGLVGGIGLWVWSAPRRATDWLVGKVKGKKP